MSNKQSKTASHIKNERGELLSLNHSCEDWQVGMICIGGVAQVGTEDWQRDVALDQPGSRQTLATGANHCSV